MYYYSVFGLVLASEITIPELIEDKTGLVPDIYIRQAETFPVEVEADRLLLQFEIDNVARYSIEGGETIYFTAQPGVEFREVRLFLLSTCMAALLHQRRELPLHVSALSTSGGAVAFSGDSGAGKSTLSAALYQRGYSLICDDVAVVRPIDQHVQLYPGAPRIKLWQDAAEHLQLDRAGLLPDLMRENKYHLPIEDNFMVAPERLHSLYILERADQGESATIIPVSGFDAAEAICRSTYRPKMVGRFNWSHLHFQYCVELAQRIRVYRYRRPWCLEKLETSLKPLLAGLPE